MYKFHTNIKYIPTIIKNITQYYLLFVANNQLLELNCAMHIHLNTRFYKILCVNFINCATGVCKKYILLTTTS